jgi:hypothetical protein
VAARDRDEELDRLREQPENVHLLGGYGPLVVGAVLLVLMVLLAPTVAPEQVVERPVHPVSTTVTLAPTTTTTAPTSTTAPASTTGGTP